MSAVQSTTGSVNHFQPAVHDDNDLDFDSEHELVDNCLLDDIPAGIEWMDMAAGESMWTICSNAFISAIAAPLGGIPSLRRMISYIAPVLE